MDHVDGAILAALKADEIARETDALVYILEVLVELASPTTTGPAA